MKKMLIVEDNKLQIQALLSYINWNELGITQIDVAYDGLDGLDKLDKINPDLIITDITMPRMNGIEMTNEIRHRGNSVKIIYMTCYEETEYLMNALKNDVISYVLKPLSKNEIYDAVKKAMQQIDCESIKANHDTDKLHILRENFLYKTILYPEYPYELSKESRSELGFDKFSTFTVVKVIPEGKGKNKDEVFGNLKLSNMYEKIRLVVENERILMLIMCRSNDKKMVQEALKKSIGDEIEMLKNEYFSKYHVIISSVSESIETIGALIKQVETVVTKDEYKVNDITLCWNEDVKEYRNLSVKNMNGFILMAEDKENMIADIVNEFDKCDSKKEYFLELCMFIKKYLVSNSILVKSDDLNIIFRYEDEYINSNKNFENWLVNIILNIKKLKREADTFDQMRKNDLVENIIDYINNNFRNINNVEDIAGGIFISSSYARKIFKQKMNMTIFEYLTNVKIDEARRLLCETNAKTDDVAYMLGYKSTSHFKSVFKKYVGQSPSDFRDRIKEHE